MKRIIIALIAIAAALVATAAGSAPSRADETLKRASAAISKAPSLTLDFTATPAGGKATAGKLTLAGNKFVLAMPDMTVWYDGKTQATLVKSQKEVNLTEPTPDELAEINPMTILGDLKKNYRGVTKKMTAALTVIELTPIKVAGARFKKIVVGIANRTNMPVSIELTPASGTPVKIGISGAKEGKKLPASYFSFNPKAHPGVEIVDLR